MLPYIVGIVLSIGVALFARLVGLDRGRAFYSTLVIVVAHYNVLFATMSGSIRTVIVEAAVMTAFAVAAIAGLKKSVWILAGALAAHGVLDSVHGRIIANSGVPEWWPGFCLSYDLGAAAALAFLIALRPRRWTMNTASMKAMFLGAYGPPDALALRDLPIPQVGAGEVIVRVQAAGLNIGDCFAVRGEPLPMRIESGLLRPKSGVPGHDVAGIVESVGTAVTKLRPGDAVFGVGRATAAEYAVVAADRLAPAPSNLPLVQAAATPVAALAALHGLRDAGRLKAGQKVLINGAAGGIGTFAVQIAKVLGADVTGVCSTGSAELVRSLGADNVIDYTREDFTRSDRRYDVVFDNVENRSLAECRRVLAPGGTLVLNSGSGERGLKLLVRLLKPLALSPFVRQRLVRYLSKPNTADLMLIKGWIESGSVRPVIDRVFPLNETAAALRHIETGHTRGKVVVRVGTAGA